MGWSGEKWFACPGLPDLPGAAAPAQAFGLHGRPSHSGRRRGVRKEVHIVTETLCNLLAPPG